VQQGNETDRGFKSFTFSIHKRIEGGATSRRRPPPPLPKPFSIHKRIEGGATKRPKCRSASLISFQYPQADRRGCNTPLCVLPRLAGRLSVSTSGSKGVQRRANHHVMDDGRLSVSTSGSKGVQRGLPARVSTFFPVFQYPQADRRGCNLFVKPAQCQCIAPFSIHKRIEGGATTRPRWLAGTSFVLSVSTSGSKGVQLPECRTSHRC